MAKKKKTKKKIKAKKTEKKVDPKNPYGLKKNVRLKSLQPLHQTRTRKELLDADYLHKIGEQELRYYAQFTDEWAGANIRKRKDGKVKKGHLHNTKELAKDCYDANNRRNNDVLGVSKANNLLQNLDNKLDENDGWLVFNPELTEDSYIEKIESSNTEEAILSLEEYKKLKNNLTEEMQNFYKKYYKLTD
jgi:hypothetical protein